MTLAISWCQVVSKKQFLFLCLFAVCLLHLKKQIKRKAPLYLCTSFSYPKAMEGILAGSARRMLGRGSIFAVGN
jgi:hypothetical protein